LAAFEYHDSLDELGKLIEHVPVVSDIPSSGKFLEGVTIDSRFPVGKESQNGRQTSKDTISFRDIVRLLSKFLSSYGHDEGQSGNWERVIHQQRYTQLRELGCKYPVNYLLFDFCLAALDGDLVDARLYLSHSLHLLGLHRAVNLVLSVIINEGLTQDGDVRYLLALLCRVTEPRNAQTYLDTYGPEFRRRYDNYIRELESVQ
jgi:hypothetical protein